MNEELTLSAYERTQFKYAMIVLTLVTAGSVHGNSIVYFLLTVIIMCAIRYLNNRDLIAQRDFVSIIIAFVAISVAFSFGRALLGIIFRGLDEEEGVANTIGLVVLIIADILGWIIYGKSADLVASSTAGTQTAATSGTETTAEDVAETVNASEETVSSSAEASVDNAGKEAAEETEGAEATVVCPNCGAVLPAKNKFCHLCGTRLKA
ncbi:MAG: zinc ribbon domain-containing protein [Lachnospiraceae bacterium]|nr:zinc ribbon domain-containing protein [Lachnospiraceae bacterium]